MADSSKIIEFIFQGVDQTSGAIDSIGKGMEDLNTAAGDIAAPFADATEALLKFETAMVALGVAFVALSVDQAGKFNAAMRELATLINGGTAETDQFSKAITTMGQTSIASLDDLTGAMYKAVSQTGNLADASEAVAAAEKLSVAGRAELTDTTLLLVGTLSAYGKGMDDATHFSDVLFAVVQNGQTTLTALNSTLSQVTGIAATAGVSIDELGAAVALLTKSGIPTEQAITGIRAALQNIISPSTEASKEAEKLGIQFNLTALSTKGLGGFFADLVTKTGGSKEALNSLFTSVEAKNAVFNLAADNGKKFSDMLGVIESASGNTQKAYELMADTFDARNQQIVNNLKLVEIAFGTSLLEPVGNVQDAITNLLIAIQQGINAGAFKPLTDAFGEAFDAIAAFLNQVATALPDALKLIDFRPLITELSLLGDTLGGIFEGVDLTTPQGLAKALQLIIDVTTSFITVTKGIAEVLGPVIALFGKWIEVFNDLEPDTKELIGNILGIGTAVSGATLLLAPFIAAFVALGGAVGTVGLILGTTAASAVVLGQSLGTASVKIADLPTNLYNLGQSLFFVQDKQISLNDAENAALGHIAALVPKWELLDNTVSLAGGTFEETTNAMGLTTSEQTAQDQALAKLVPSWQVLDDTVSLIGGSFQKVTDTLGTTAEATAAAGKANDALLLSWREVDGVAHDVTLGTDLAAHGIRSFSEEAVISTDGTSKMVTVFKTVGPAAEDAGDKSAKALSKTAAEALAAEKASNDFELAWRKIESDEKNLSVKTNADIIMAQIVAGTEQVKAAFESVNVTIESTGNTLVGLAGILANIGSGPNAGVIIDLLEQENKRRQEALDMQKKLVEAQIQYLDAVVRRMTQGDAMITVTADGLEPELEAFMFKILERIQVQASAEAQQFLLGL